MKHAQCKYHKIWYSTVNSVSHSLACVANAIHVFNNDARKMRTEKQIRFYSFAVIFLGFMTIDKNLRSNGPEKKSANSRKWREHLIRVDKIFVISVMVFYFPGRVSWEQKYRSDIIMHLLFIRQHCKWSFDKNNSILFDLVLMGRLAVVMFMRWKNGRTWSSRYNLILFVCLLMLLFFSFEHMQNSMTNGNLQCLRQFK